jgi:hypothetical protein
MCADLKLAALIVVQLACGLLLRAGPVGTNDAQLRARFDQLVFPAVASAVHQSATNLGGNIAWGPAYPLAALVEMFDVTRDAKYARRIVQLGDWIAVARDDQNGLRDEIRGQSFPAWSTPACSEGKRYVWAVHTGTIVAPLARFAAVIRSDPKLAAQWDKDAERLLQVAEAAVSVDDADYRDGPGPDEGYLYCPYLKKPLPLNMQNALAQAWLAIDDANQNTRHRERIKRLARFTKNRLRAMDDGSYVWAYWPPLAGTNASFEDISHAAGNINFMVRCFEHDIVFSRADLTRLEQTLLNRVLQPDGRIADTVGGTGEFDHHRSAALRWGRLARYSTAVREPLGQLTQREEFAQDTTSLPLGLVCLMREPGDEVGK